MKSPDIFRGSALEELYTIHYTLTARFTIHCTLILRQNASQARYTTSRARLLTGVPNELYSQILHDQISEIWITLRLSSSNECLKTPKCEKKKLQPLFSSNPLTFVKRYPTLTHDSFLSPQNVINAVLKGPNMCVDMALTVARLPKPLPILNPRDSPPPKRVSSYKGIKVRGWHVHHHDA